MLLSEFRAFRKAVVEALKDHPEWKKTKACPYDLAETVLPAAPGARTYWRVRNGTQGVARKYANIEEEALARLGCAAGGHADWEIDPQDARKVEKWRHEFEELLA